MCARCLNEGMFIPGAKRLRRKAVSAEVPTLTAPKIASEPRIENDELSLGLVVATGCNQMTTTWLTPIPLVINLTLSLTILIVNLLLIE